MGKTLTGPELAAMRVMAAAVHGVDAVKYDDLVVPWQRAYDELAAMLNAHFGDPVALPVPPVCMHERTTSRTVATQNIGEVIHMTRCLDCGKEWREGEYA